MGHGSKVTGQADHQMLMGRLDHADGSQSTWLVIHGSVNWLTGHMGHGSRVSRLNYSLSYTGNYTLNHKKRDILFLTITLANLRPFL